MKEGIIVRMIQMMMSLAMLSTASLSSTGLMDTSASVSGDAALVRMEAKWANADRITFVDEHSLFNSGVAKLQVGKPVTVHATINYSGDLAPILQSVVTFENVDPSLAIDYDGTLVFDGKQATFSFTVTLLESIQSPKLFSVKVSDGQPEDNQYLTPYSQRQTVIEEIVLKDPTTESSSEPKEEPSTTSTEESETGSTVPPIEESIEISSELPIESSSKPIEETKESTESSTKPSDTTDTGSSEESKIDSTEPSEEDHRKMEQDSSSGKKRTDTKGNKVFTTNSKSMTKAKKAGFPATGENTSNRLFPVGVFVTAVALLVALYVSDRKKK